MIICQPNLLSKGYQLKFEDGREGSLTVELFTGQVHLHLPEGTYEVAKESLFRYRWNLTREGERIATADKPNPFTRTHEITSDQGNITIQPRSLFFCRFDLQMNGEKVGSIVQANVFTRRTIVNGLPSLPEALQVFAFALVGLMWRRARK